MGASPEREADANDARLARLSKPEAAAMGKTLSGGDADDALHDEPLRRQPSRHRRRRDPLRHRRHGLRGRLERRPAGWKRRAVPPSGHALLRGLHFLGRDIRPGDSIRSASAQGQPGGA
jgi:hypothetical protein